ncbi:hypothetical protein [Qipengyuania sp.]|uniref:hypothetical protein n=1 Tax=Qipengyuania sp. TaxID=2004515 RepID=UPI003510D9F1
MLEHNSSEYATAAAKSAPPVAVLAADTAGLTLEQWVFIATLIYLALQSIYLLYKFGRDLRAARTERRDG